MTPVITPSKSRQSTPSQTPMSKPQYFTISESTRNALAKYQSESGLTNPAMGKMLGFADGTAVSKYLNNKYDRDPKDIESKILDMLKTEARRLQFGGEVINTSVIRQVAGFLDSIKRTNTVGVIHSDAGLGKTTAANDYLDENPNAVLLTVNAKQNDAKGFVQLLWAAIVPHGYEYNQSRWEYLVQKFKESGRLIMIDNAQRLIGSGRDAAFDFRDETGCPLCFFGNPSVLVKIKQNDQQHSRTIMEHEATLLETDEVTRMIVDQHTDHGEEIYDLCLPITKRKAGGHIRALTMILACMKDFMDMPGYKNNPRKAFIAALSKNIHHKA